jgi:hypothetical protein
MNLLDLTRNIGKIKQIASGFGFKKVILHNLADEDEEENDNPVRLMIVPKVSERQLDYFSFLLSQGYKTSFEIYSINEENKNFPQFVNPNNGIDILTEESISQETFSRIFNTSADQFQSIEFNSQELLEWCHIPEELKEIMQRYFSEKELRAIHRGDDTFTLRDTIDSHVERDDKQQGLLFKGPQMQPSPVVPSTGQLDAKKTSLKQALSLLFQQQFSDVPSISDKQYLLGSFESEIYPEVKREVLGCSLDSMPRRGM